MPTHVAVGTPTKSATFLGATTLATATNTYTTGRLAQIVGFMCSDNGANFTNPTLTDNSTGGPLSWVRQHFYSVDVGDGMGIAVWTAVVGADNTFTVTMTTDQTMYQGGIYCGEFTDFLSGDPITNVGTATASDGGATNRVVTLPSGITANSSIFGAQILYADLTGTVTPGADFTDLWDSASSDIPMHLMIDAAGGDTTVDWADSFSTGTTTPAVRIGWEVFHTAATGARKARQRRAQPIRYGTLPRGR